ncbi:MAG: response regulator [Bacteriovoracia bacterium]
MSALLVAIFIGVLSYLLARNAEIAEIDLAISEETETLKLVVDAETGLRGFLLGKDKTYLDPYTTGVAQIGGRFDSLEKHLQATIGESHSLRSVREKFDRWNKAAEVAIERGTKGHASDNQGMLSRKDDMDSIRADFGAIHQKLETSRSELAAVADTRSRQVALGTALFTLVIGAFMALSGRSQLIALSSSYEESMAVQAKQNELLAKSAWIKSGQAQLAEKVRGDLSREVLTKQILNFLAGYSGAQVGAFYTKNQLNRFERTAQFAYAENELGVQRREFAYGEGLVGQTAETRTILSLSNIPDNYVKVTSGTGDALPRHLILAPAYADGVSQGVIELAFLQHPKEEVLALLDGSAEIIGNAVQSMIFRTRLQQLLEESQQLTEELQAQQEELRVSNEELEERTRVLQETQSRLESQHAELEQTNEQLEEQASVLEEQKRNLDSQNRVLEDASREIEKKATELESASRYKSEFLANMSHELRTPLNSTLILATLLKNNSTGNLTEEQIEFANTIYSSGNDLLQLINDILDLSKVESGNLEILPEPIEVKDMLIGLERTMRPAAGQKKIDFRLAENRGPKVVVSDRQRVEQILKNLLSNAIKFTEHGHVELSCEKDGEDRVRFRVRDTGIGIDPSQQQIIFEAFRQADGTTSRKFGGTGLGLSISLNLARLLGGTISVESAPGRGSVFTLELPLKYEKMKAETQLPHAAVLPPPRTETASAPAQKPAKRTKPERLTGVPFEDDREKIKPGDRRVLLVVEDEPKFAHLLYKFAHEFKYNCLVVDNIAEGFKSAEEFLPTAIILDVKLPDGSGLALLDRLKQNPRTRHIPVYGLSVQDYSMEALHLGAAGFGLKPHDADELRKVFEKIEAKMRAQTKRVLVVEDDPVQRAGIERLVGEKGVEIISVGAGQEALEQLGKTVFDCMIMDLRLPDMEGNELLERMVKNSAAPIPPVVVYTGKEIDRREEEALSRYSRSIIIKGARSPERLLDEVTLFLHQPEAELSAERQKMLRSSRNRERAFDGRKILLVDDDVRNIFALTNALEQKGASIVIARNGREAIEKVNTESELDLILMDVMMPEMDGLEATRRIRSGARSPEIPVIAVTAKAMRDDYEKCLEAGANDYLAKPVDVEKLVSLIRVWLPKRLGGA